MCFIQADKAPLAFLVEPEVQVGQVQGASQAPQDSLVRTDDQAHKVHLAIVERLASRVSQDNKEQRDPLGREDKMELAYQDLRDRLVLLEQTAEVHVRTFFFGEQKSFSCFCFQEIPTVDDKTYTHFSFRSCWILRSCQLLQSAMLQQRVRPLLRMFPGVQTDTTEIQLQRTR